MEIDTIDLLQGKKGKDFGQGFNLNPDKKQALGMARRTSLTMGIGKPTISTVVGPIADDTVGVQLRRYIMGYIPIDVLIEELRFHGTHAIQYFFGTSQAVSLLKKVGYEQ